VLTGAFCATCGQHAHASARTLSAVVHDGWHDLTHLDGRLWCSLWFLLARPGQLTVDYFAERRARYLPPVRLYLVLSLLFFSFSLATHDHEYPRTHPAAGASHRANADAEASDDEDDDTPRLSCDDIKVEGSEALQRSAQAACERGRRKNGTEFWRSVAHNIPKMMFVFLPLVAVALKLLYWRPRRFYVEHLVYLLHNHSALFLCFSMFVFIERLASLWHPLRWVTFIAGTMTFMYTACYPYASMRRYYGQSRSLTSLKYMAVMCAYVACLSFTLIGLAVIAALERS
jgi:hypothetical protein